MKLTKARIALLKQFPSNGYLRVGTDRYRNKARMLDAMAKDALVIYWRGEYEITEAGKQALAAAAK